MSSQGSHAAKSCIAANVVQLSADSAVAFNRGAPGQAGEIWYNAACDPAETDGQQERAKHWFLTACHELGHNFVRRHNSAFADVMGQIVMRYTPRFHIVYDIP